MHSHVPPRPTATATYEQTFAPLRDRIFGLIVMRVYDRDVAEDLTQWTLYYGYTALQRGAIQQPWPYLCRIANNRIINWKQREKQRRPFSLNDPVICREGEDPDYWEPVNEDADPLRILISEEEYSERLAQAEAIVAEQKKEAARREAYQQWVAACEARRLAQWKAERREFARRFAARYSPERQAIIRCVVEEGLTQQQIVKTLGVTQRDVTNAMTLFNLHCRQEKELESMEAEQTARQDDEGYFASNGAGWLW